MEASYRSKKEYAALVAEVSPKSPMLKNCVRAFVSGGLICTAAQLLLERYGKAGFSEEEAALLVSVTLIGIASLLTALGLYHRLGKHCGAGTLVPITGFANSVAAPALEFQKEGLIFGTGAKMFVVAGPVIVYGTLTSMLVGAVYYFFG